MDCNYTKFVYLLLTAVLFLFCPRNAFCAEPRSHEYLKPGKHKLSVTVGRLERYFTVYLPKSSAAGQPMPVVLMFHGGGGTAAAAMKETEWPSKAEQFGFLAVFPDGTRSYPQKPARFLGNPQNWNDGSNRMNVGAVARKVNDVKFVDAIIDSLISRYSVDESRIYATGFSNGASMAFRVGRELSHRLAAIAPVAGADWLENTPPAMPISVLYIVGTADRQNPIEGGKVKLGFRTFGQKPPVKKIIDTWVSLLNCASDPHIRYEKDGVKGIAYSPCAQETEVLYYTVTGMGHTWPGGISLLPEFLVGKTSQKINGSDLIWKFFSQHRKQKVK